MSEYINNSTQRKQLLKEILKGLHEGKPMEAVKQQFTELVKVADAGEIAEVEQMLIAEGYPVESIQNLCDMHVAVVRESLDQQRPHESTPGHPVYSFKAENEAADLVLRSLRLKIEDYVKDANAANTKAILGVLTDLRAYEKHYLRKENLLFPMLEKHSFYGPSQVMWGIHDQVRQGWKTLQETLETQKTPEAEVLMSALETFETPMREMFYKEDKILFPAALERLSEDEWHAIRENEAELGYFMIEAGREWKSARQVIVEEETRTETAAHNGMDGLVGLRVGALSAEQITLMLSNLPVDVTFVDENDRVRFFSQSKERIFERQETIIGRKVQYCHPPASMDKVQRILDDFRAGKRDVAAFWIRMGGKFIHIRYFAMRDEAGAYRGTLEVTQEISGIRALEGERRLLDD